MTPADGVDPRADEADAARDADLVLSVNSSHDAMDALLNALPSVRPRDTASPGLKAALAEATGASIPVVDVALMAPVPGKGLRTPMLVSGDGADRYAAILSGFGAEVAIQPGLRARPSRASCSAASSTRGWPRRWWKRWPPRRQQAASTGCATTSAPRAGFDQRTIDRLVDGTHQHARRRADEMTAATEQLEELGVPSRISAATRDLLIDLRDNGGR